MGGWEDGRMGGWGGRQVSKLVGRKGEGRRWIQPWLLELSIVSFLIYIFLLILFSFLSKSYLE
jgi:hypothetical protein